MKRTIVPPTASMPFKTPAYAASSKGVSAVTATTDSIHDFDPLVGRWSVRHRRLKARLAGSHEWIEFEGATQFWTTMDGYGIVDDNYIGLPEGPYRAMTLRTYDAKTQTWAIWWCDGRSPHRLDPPVIGAFNDGVGVFYADDALDGKPIKVRFIWSKITAASAQWEQAFSPDGGKSWETNWLMHFTRIDP